MSIVRLFLILALLILSYSFTLLVTMTPWVLVAAVALLLAANAKKGYTYLSSQGTARWADEADLKRAGMLDADTGLLLGRITATPPGLLRATKTLFDYRVKSSAACEQFVQSLRRFKKQSDGPLVRLSKAVHTAVFAPTGVGKGVSIVLPFLQQSTESAVVIDFKGENAALTADRRRGLGHKVVVLDPFRHTTQTPDSFNPLVGIDRNSPLALDDCRDLANALVLTTGQEKDPHFTESAKVWIASMIAVVVYYAEPADRSLQTVRGLLADPKKMQQAVELMCRSDAWGGMMARMGHQLTHYKDKELASTLTTTLRFLYFLDTPAVAESTRGSSFDPAELCGGKMTVYLILPPEFMRSQASLLRMWIGSMIRAVVRGGLQETHKVHFVLDESASLGHLEALDDAVDKFRGYGLRLIFLYQSLGQLSKCFPDGQEQTLLSNTTQIFFGVNDKDTAEYVSARLGEETIVVDSGGTNDGDSRSFEQSGSGSSSNSRGRSSSWAQQARKLLKPEEVTALPQRTAITFTPGIPPLWTTLVRYYEGQGRGSFKPLCLKLEIMTVAVLLLALSIGLAVQVTAVARHPQGAPNGSASR